MICSFRNEATADICHGRHTCRALKCCPSALWSVAQRKLDMLNAATKVEDLRVPPGNRLEKLQGDRAGYYSIRINGQYRIVFRWHQADGAGWAEAVEIVDYH